MLKLRKKIDTIDDQLLKIIIERVRVAKQIGNKKNQDFMPVYSAQREAEVYRHLIQENNGSLGERSLVAIFREIMSACINAQGQMRVAYLGPEATFTHQAALSKFGSSVVYASQENISDVFDAVLKRSVNYGVVPVENSSEGAITHTLDLFLDLECRICSEIYLPIEHNLLFSGALKDIRRVYSKREVYSQCRDWLHKHLNNVELLEASSTARAAEIAKKEKGSAAIASAISSEIYHVPILEKNIQDAVRNVTRFLVIGHDKPVLTGKDKTSIIFSIRDEVGALNNALKPFQQAHINLCKIESRPSKKKHWEYYFFVDFEGHYQDPMIEKTLFKLKKHSNFVKVLGSYPIADWDQENSV